jgi:hypothetical protein
MGRIASPPFEHGGQARLHRKNAKVNNRGQGVESRGSTDMLAKKDCYLSSVVVSHREG